MKINPFAFSVYGVLALGGLAWAQQPATPSALCVDEAQVPHPLFRSTGYPSWSAMTPKQAIEDTEAAVLIARRELGAITALAPEQMTFRNTFIAYGEAVVHLEQSQQYLHHLTAVTDNQTLQQVQGYLMGALHQFDAELMQNDRLWQTLKIAAAQPWVQQLSAEEQRIVSQTLQHFIHGGANLTPEQKQRKAAINTELGMLAMKYGNNIKASTASWSWLVTDKSALRGIPENRLALAEAEARARGLSSAENPAWLLTLTNGLAQDAVRYCNVAETRRQCWEATKSIGTAGEYDNAPIVARMIALRAEYAQLIGYANYADMKAADRMVENGRAAMSFVDNLLNELKPTFEAENAKLLEYVSRLKNEEVTALEPWDELKYSSMMAGEQFAFNTSSIRPYLEKDRVVAGLLNLCGSLFGVTYREIPTACVQTGQEIPAGCVEVWHPDVKLYAVHDAATGELLGSFYMDLLARKGKRPGAWCMPLRVGKTADDGTMTEPHLAALMASFNQPAPGQPVLFSHPELQILFHEFGHMMHYMLGRTQYRRQGSPSVAWDFAELPSQLLENLAWQPAVLSQIAYHYQTGEAYPADLLGKLAASRSFMPATGNMRSLTVAKLDLALHMDYEKSFAGKELDAASSELLAPWTPPYSVTPPSVVRNLLHCFQGGYAAGYYSYKWSENLSADAFMHIQQNGMLNPEIWQHYRKTILEPGDSKPAAQIYRDFLGREPNSAALLHSQNLQ